MSATTDTLCLTLHASAMMIVCVINLCPPFLMSLWMRIKSPLLCASSRKCVRHGTEIRWNNFCITTHENRSIHSFPFFPLVWDIFRDPKIKWLFFKWLDHAKRLTLYADLPLVLDAVVLGQVGVLGAARQEATVVRLGRHERHASRRHAAVGAHLKKKYIYC